MITLFCALFSMVATACIGVIYAIFFVLGIIYNILKTIFITKHEQQQKEKKT